MKKKSTIGQFSEDIDDVGDVKGQLVGLLANVGVQRLHLRTIPRLVHPLLGVVLWGCGRGERSKPSLLVRLQRARQNLNSVNLCSKVEVNFILIDAPFH